MNKKETFIAVAITLIVVFGMFLGFFSFLKFFSSSDEGGQNLGINLEENLSENNNIVMEKEGGLKVEILEAGFGEVVKAGDVISVHYRGTLENGTEFDSSYKRSVPAEFPIGIGRVIQGWDQSLVGAKVGDKVKLWIPSDLAYGPNAVGNLIPANSNLIFEVEILGIVK